MLHCVRSSGADPRWLAAAGIAGPALLWGVTLVLGAVSPGYDPVRRSISALATTPLGGLMSATFIATALLELAFAAGVRRTMGATQRQRRLVELVVVVLAFLILLFALFPTDPPDVPRSSVGRLHLLVALGYSVALPVSAVVFAWVFARDARWHRHRRPTLLVALAQVALFPVLVNAVNGELRPWLGLIERLYFAIPSLWQAWIALAALRNRCVATPDSC